MTIAHRGLKVVMVMGQANVVGPTSIQGSFFFYFSFLLAQRAGIL